MKKSLLIMGVALALFSCNNTPTASTSEFKTAYVDATKLSKDYEAFKDLEAQSKVKQEELGRELDAKVEKYKQDRAAAENQVQTKGPQWAQLKAQEFQRTEQEIQVMQQTMIKQLQDEFGIKNDSAVKKMKDYIKDYGKKNGYDYIYSSGDVASILYAKDGYDITDKILKELNDKYKGTAKTEEPKKEEKK
jgi:outer membrane protein